MKTREYMPRRIPTLVLFAVLVTFLAALATAQRSAREPVHEAIGELKAGIEGRARARERLRELPSEQVIASLIRHLREDPAFEDPAVRGVAYALLDDHRAETTDIGREQLLFGLANWGYGAEALARVGAVPEVVKALGKKLQEGMPTPDVGVVRALGSLGAGARDYLPPIEEVFGNQQRADYTLRFNASKAMVSIGGIERALTHFQQAEDPEGQRIVLSTLGYYGVQTKGIYDTDHRQREQIRAFVLEKLKSDDRGVRRTALTEALGAAFWEDYVVIRSRHDYEMNAQVRAALEYMAANDPDEGLREKAGELLVADLDPIVAKILRIRAQQDKEQRNPGE